jgi:glucokinase
MKGLMDERDDAAYLGVDLGGTEIKAAVLAADGRPLWSGKRLTGAGDAREAVLGRLIDVAAEAAHAVSPRRLRAAAYTIPGVFDASTGKIELLTNFAGDWAGFPLRDALAGGTGLPVSLINDVRAATVAEHALGAGRGYTDFLCIAIGTGIGGGVVLDGRLYLGSRGAAGEIGHQTMEPDGPRCNCGNCGCLEAVASGYAIVREARAAVASGELTLDGEPTPHRLSLAARDGNAAALAIYRRVGTYIGRALANIICVLNPEAIVVGGGIALAGEVLLAPIREEIARRTTVFTPARGGVEVLASPLGDRAGALGAALWAMREIGADVAAGAPA